MGYSERYEDRQKKQGKKEKKEQLDFFLLEKGSVIEMTIECGLRCIPGGMV